MFKKDDTPMDSVGEHQQVPLKAHFYGMKHAISG